jgi:Flp pilus assembly protein TadG
MIRRSRHNLGRKGGSAVEFALLSPGIMLLLAWGIDLGLMTHARGALNNAVSVGAQYAYISGLGVLATDVRKIISDTAGLLDASGLNGVTTQVVGPGCYCVSKAGATPVLTVALTCTATCPDGSIAGGYISVTASYTYTPMMPLLNAMVSTVLSEHATVRIK